MQSHPREPTLLNLVHLFALFGFAVGAPTFALLRDNPEFMIAHGVGRADLALLVASIGLGLPLVAWLVELAVGFFSRPIAHALHLTSVGVLVCLTSLPPLLRAFPNAGSAAVAAPAVAAGCAAALLYSRFEPIRRFVAVLTMGPLVFAAAFWFAEPTAKVRGGGEAGAAAMREPVTASSPIVWVVFDELPIASLLDAKRRIDASRFRSFATIASNATWFRDTAAVAEETAMAVPPILTGRYPEMGRLPIASDHPDNLFSLLAPSFEMNVVETRTLLHGRGRRANGSRGADRRQFYSDLAILFAHVVAPPAIAVRLPSVDADWKGFEAPTEAALGKIQGRNYANRVTEFARFLTGIQACETQCLHFVHVVLPHVPWQYVPSGKRYTPASSFGIHRDEGRWVDDPWWSTEGQKRHLLQLAFADSLLGELVNELRRNDLYDRSLLIVTADHGASFWPGQTRRLLEGHSHPGDILRVPLLVKAPFQKTGRISDAPIQTIDILPTVLDLLDITLPWQIDGRSALADDFEGRERRIAFDMEGRRHEYDRDDLGVDASLARRIEQFGQAHGNSGLFAAGRYGALVGRSPSEFEQRPTGRLRLQLASEPFDLAKKFERMTAARLSGRFLVPKVVKGEHQLAIAVGGVIRVVAPTFRVALLQRAFTLVVPQAVAASEPTELAFHLVTGPPEHPVLQPARVEVVPIQKKLIHTFNRNPGGLVR